MPTFRAIFKRFLHINKPFCNSTVTSVTTVLNPSKLLTCTRFCTNISLISDHLKNQRVDEDRRLFDKIPSPDVYLSAKMLPGYVESFILSEALQLFDEMPVRDVVMWNLMIKVCVSCELDLGLKLFNEMPEKNVVSWTIVIDALLKCGKVEEAKGLFREMPESDVAAWNTKVNGCFKNGEVAEAVRLFEGMPDRNVISWTAMISGLDQHGKSDQALAYFVEMVGLGIRPTWSTFSCAATACASMGDLCLDSQVHTLVLKLDYVFDPFIAASLITFYAKMQTDGGTCKGFL